MRLPIIIPLDLRPGPAPVPSDDRGLEPDKASSFRRVSFAFSGNEARAYSAVIDTDESSYSLAIISSMALISRGDAGSISESLRLMDVLVLSTVAETTIAPLKSAASLSLSLQNGNISNKNTGFFALKSFRPRFQ